MLDVNKLMPQLERISIPPSGNELDEKLAKAAAVLADAASHEDAFRAKLKESGSLTFWPLPTAIEPINCVYEIPRQKQSVTVAATDGSQITPSHHEVYNCYLLNIGRIMLSYGTKQPVLMESTPHLFHAVEDLYPLIDRRRAYVDETFIGLERSLMELNALRDLALEGLKRSLPVVAFLDGSLTPWSLDQMPEAYQVSYLQRINAIYASFLDNSIPVVGYISHSRASEVVNAMRVWQCPYAAARCSTYCGQLCEEDYPCSTIWPLMDRQLFSESLVRRSRSPLFVSGNPKAFASEPPYHLAFTYIHTGNEIARVEMPYWLTQNETLLNLALSTVVEQSEKGRGYPICLAEAHNQAVITGGDRSRFFQLLQRFLAQTGVHNVGVSPKETGKRRGIV
jgi:hypothetical protein